MTLFILFQREFKEHFRNISRIMDCVGCDKCKLWGKLQVRISCPYNYRPHRSCGKVMFSQASVILFIGEGACIPACTGQTPLCHSMLGYPPPRPVYVVIHHPASAAGIHTPPAQEMLGCTPPGSHCSGRYVSYWNAFLFFTVTYIAAGLNCEILSGKV